MKITDDFINQSIFDDDFLNNVKYGYFEDILNNKDNLKVIIIEPFEAVKQKIATFNILIKNLEDQNYSEAKKWLGTEGDFNFYSREIFLLRNEIKSLLKGLISISTIKNVSEIEKYKEQWRYCENYSHRIHQQMVYNQFKLVKTIEHLTDFHNYLRNYLLRLVLNLYEIMNRRIRFTLQYFQEEKVFENELHEAMK